MDPDFSKHLDNFISVTAFLVGNKIKDKKGTNVFLNPISILWALTDKWVLDKL